MSVLRVVAFATAVSALLVPTLSSSDPGAESSPCVLTGGGCLSVVPNTKKAATFGGAVGTSPSFPFQHSWEHIYRDGRSIVFNFQSDDAHIVHCRPEHVAGCSPSEHATRVEFAGTGMYSTSSDAPDQPANFEASALDIGPCGTIGQVDEYSIAVRQGSILGEGAVIYELSGAMTCGNLQAKAPWEHSTHP